MNVNTCKNFQRGTSKGILLLLLNDKKDKHFRHYRSAVLL